MFLRHSRIYYFNYNFNIIKLSILHSSDESSVVLMVGLLLFSSVTLHANFHSDIL